MATWKVKQCKGHPWTAEEDAIVRTLPVKEAMRQLGLSKFVIHRRRRLLGVGLSRHEFAPQTKAANRRLGGRLSM